MSRFSPQILLFKIILNSVEHYCAYEYVVMHYTLERK